MRLCFQHCVWFCFSVLLILCGPLSPALALPTTLYDPLHTPAMAAPKASKAWLMDVAVNGQRVLMVGERGVVLYADVPVVSSKTPNTVPSAVVWQQAKVPVSLTLTAVAFATRNIAYAVGHDGVVLKSEDAGASWREVFDGNKANTLVVQAASARLAQAQQTSTPAAIEEAELALEDAQAGARFGPTRPLLGVWFRNAQQGWVVGSYGQLFYTADGGTNWALQTQLNNPDARHFNSIVGNEEGLLLIAAEAGRVYRSNNFGASWQRLETGYNGPWFGALPMPGGGVLAYGLNGHVAVQSQADAPWLRLTSPGQHSLVAAVPTPLGAYLLNQQGQLFIYEHARRALSAWPGPTVVQERRSFFMASAMAQQGQALWLAGQGGPRAALVISINNPKQ